MPTILRTNSDDEILRELGARLRGYRLQQNLAVADVARQAGLNRNTIVNAEAGRNPRLATVVRLLRVYDRIDGLDAFLPPPLISPLQLLRTRGRPRQRARRHG
ncbi:MAG: helix-turn-helix transcriptional regulator [Gemmatimonadales bacterium]